MTEWADLEAQIILDELRTDEGPGNLQVLQAAIARALARFYARGRAATRLDEPAV